MTTISQHRWLTVRETVELIRVSQDTVRRAIAKGELPAVQLGGRGSSIRVDEAELGFSAEEGSHERANERGHELLRELANSLVKRSDDA